MNGAFDALDPASRARIEALFTGPLSEVGLLNIGQETGREGFFKHTLRLVTDPNGRTFSPIEHSVPTAA